jgi:hypothetical protein
LALSVYLSENFGKTHHIIRAHLDNFYNAYKCISQVLAYITIKCIFGPKYKFRTIYALNIFKYEKYVLQLFLTKQKSIKISQKAK